VSGALWGRERERDPGIGMSAEGVSGGEAFAKALLDGEAFAEGACIGEVSAEALLDGEVSAEGVFAEGLLAREMSAEGPPTEGLPTGEMPSERETAAEKGASAGASAEMGASEELSDSAESVKPVKSANSVVRSACSVTRRTNSVIKSASSVAKPANSAGPARGTGPAGETKPAVAVRHAEAARTAVKAGPAQSARSAGAPRPVRMAKSPGAPTSAEMARSAAPARSEPGAEARPEVGSTTHEPVGRPVAVDPVKALMQRHKELCERAVDPLEIAAALETHGVTDRTASRYRHRDVFSLAEEMYARAPRDNEPAHTPAHTVSDQQGRPVDATRPRSPRAARLGGFLLTLLPGTLCAATVTATQLTERQLRLGVMGAGALAVTMALRIALRTGPLHTAQPVPGARVWTCWLLLYAVVGDGLLYAVIAEGPDSPWQVTVAPVLGLALSFAPAAWCAKLYTAAARRRLTTSHGLAEFTASVRPLLLGSVALYLCALAGLLRLSGSSLGEDPGYAATIALGALLLLARLLAAHGITRVPAVALAAAAAAESLATVAVLVGRLPGCAAVAAPVTETVDTWGPAAVPAAVCAAVALVLLVHADRTLTRASAHAPADGIP